MQRGSGIGWATSWRQAQIRRCEGVSRPWCAPPEGHDLDRGVGRAFPRARADPRLAHAGGAFASRLLLNLLYFVLMIDDWAEQGQNSMMMLAAAVVLGAHGGQAWSIDHLIGIF